MTYCRFSSENFGCDLLIYKSEEGYVIEVAKDRIAGVIPQTNMALLAYRKDKEYFAQVMRQAEFIETAKRIPINLPFDGQKFIEPDYEALGKRLLLLEASGYRCNYRNVFSGIRNDEEGVKETLGDKIESLRKGVKTDVEDDPCENCEDDCDECKRKLLKGV